MTYYTSEQKKANRERLAQYLASLPLNYQGFEMGDFFESLDVVAKRHDYVNGKIKYDDVRKAIENAKEMTTKYARENGGVAQCGAVACAVGHGPSAGFLLIDADFYGPDLLPDWMAYTSRVFLDQADDDTSSYNYDSEHFAWMFRGSWSGIDNTPHGAAARIRYFNENGIPDDFDQDDPDTFDPALYDAYLR